MSSMVLEAQHSVNAPFLICSGRSGGKFRSLASEPWPNRGERSNQTCGQGALGASADEPSSLLAVNGTFKVAEMRPRTHHRELTMTGHTRARFQLVWNQHDCCAYRQQWPSASNMRRGELSLRNSLLTEVRPLAWPKPSWSLEGGILAVMRCASNDVANSSEFQLSVPTRSGLVHL